LAFQNHLGHRLQVADHPMHALVLGAAHLLATDNENGEPESAGRHAEPTPPRPAPAPPRQAEQVPSRPDLSAPRPVEPAPHSVESAQHQAEAVQQQAISPQRQAEAQRQVDSPQRQAEPVQGRPDQSQPQWPVQYGPGYPTVGPAPEAMPSEEPTTRVPREEVSRGLPPGLAELGSRFTRPPGQQPDEQRTTAMGHPPAQPQLPAPGAPMPPPMGPRTPYGTPPPGPEQARQWGEQPPESEDDDKPRKGKRWNKIKDNLFGAPTVIGAVALALVVMPSDGERSQPEVAAAVSCALTPQVTNEHRPGISHVRGFPIADPDCVRPSIDTLRYVVPAPPGATDPGPPIEI
jgi:hypothetical protein